MLQVAAVAVAVVLVALYPAIGAQTDPATCAAVRLEFTAAAWMAGADSPHLTAVLPLLTGAAPHLTARGRHPGPGRLHSSATSKALQGSRGLPLLLLSQRLRLLPRALLELMPPVLLLLLLTVMRPLLLAVVVLKVWMRQTQTALLP